MKGIFIRLICFYQNKLSRHTCLYSPTCSEYTKRCIRNFGVIFGILLGSWRILRCNPLSKGGYDPAPEPFYKKKWLV
ncbi:MAG: membrane protein insertion efficiency factor YidD [Clostridia bacterium]|nr:membrane protein insertion efficiency factor YidD [Clostridia bacterium]